MKKAITFAVAGLLALVGSASADPTVSKGVTLNRLALNGQTLNRLAFNGLKPSEFQEGLEVIAIEFR